MKAKYIGVLFSCALVALFCSCGQTYEMQSITLTAASTSTGGSYNLKGMGGTLQLVVTANYSNGKSEVVTPKATYTIVPDGTDDVGVPLPAPPRNVSISGSGLMTAVEPFVCTWTNLGTDLKPSYMLTGSYKVTATFDKMQSQPVFIGVASLAGDGPGGACGPQ